MTRRAALFVPAIALAALATPALACDFHGANGYSQLYGANWQAYSPQVSTMDPAMMDPAMRAALESTPANAAPVPPRRPTFSTVASRASKSALKRRAEAKKKTETSDKVQTAALKKTGSDADRQPVRN